MIHKSINLILISAVFVLSLYLIEGACFRLVEPYAKWRLNFSWGSPDFARQNPILNKFPLDHFSIPPGNVSGQKSHSSSIEEEFEYARKIMSFNRPMRDKYCNFVTHQKNPLRRFEIVDLDSVKEVVLPGLRRPAMSLDVELGLSRRQGLPLGYSKGLFVYVIQPGNRSSYEDEFLRLESSFSFLLNHGIACVLINPESAEEFLAKLKFLKAKYPNFSEKIFVYAEGKTVKTIEDAIGESNALLSCLIVKDPTDKMKVVPNSSFWFMGILSKASKDTKVLSSLIQRARLNRHHMNLYQSRLSGLLFEESTYENLPISSNVITYVLNCLEFYRPSDTTEPEANVIRDENISLQAPLMVGSEENISEALSITWSGDAAFLESEPNFECEVISEYRLINGDDPEILNISNRELVLQLGASFEEMGEDVLLQIGERDPIFYRFYLSLKEIHKAQN